MTTIIMLISLPIGIYILFKEKKEMQKYQAIFDNFYKNLASDNSLSNDKKINLAKEMFYKNNYNIVKSTDESVMAEKKLFSVGWLFVGIGTLYVGLIVYIIYFFYFQKPHILIFDTKMISSS